ncbi:MAG: SCO family protein [Ignavibacteriaceae bacterium]|nr:SCO family protein [Ignavibacteriaceae bacterium]
MKPLFVLLSAILIISGCASKFDRNDPLGKKSFPLISQDSTVVNFPQDYKGKTMVLGFIFTNCPDVCPLTSHNFQMLQEEAKNKGIKGVNFVLISFDPDRDKPWVLKDYAKVRGIDESNFKLLTGDKDTIRALMRKMQIVAVPGDTTKTSDGELMYFFVHSDKAFLIDKDNRVRSEYRGSKLDIAEAIKDLQALE